MYMSKVMSSSIAPSRVVPRKKVKGSSPDLVHYNLEFNS